MKVEIRHHGRVIRGILSFPIRRKLRRSPAVVLIHGSFADRTYRWFPRLARQLRQRGFAVLAVDLNGHGQSSRPLERFTWTSGVEDVAAAVTYLARDRRINSHAIGGVGHSLGGTLLLIALARGIRLKAIAMVAPIGDSVRHLHRDFPPALVRVWRREGRLKWFHESQGRTLTLGYDYYSDRLQYDTLALAHEVHQPTLLIHGDDDPRVPVAEARRLFRHLNDPKELIVLPGTRHSFRDSASRRSLFSVLLPWLKAHLADPVSRSVVAVVRNGDRYLSLRRSRRVWYYPGSWAIIGGHLPDGVDPRRQIIEEIVEETGIPRSALRIVAASSTIRLPNPDVGRTWYTRVFLVESSVRRITLDWEHDAYRWVPLHRYPFKLAYSDLRKQFRALGLV